jgi:hypothetical protein
MSEQPHILAMGAGRRAAKSIHDYLTTGEW